MDVSFSIDFDPNLASFERELKTDIEREGAAVLREIVELAPAEMRDLMGNNPPSARGNPPANRSGDLSRSFTGTMTSAATGQIAMIYYAGYLDPFLGGHLDRPLVEEGVDRAVVKVMRSL